jgi:membrane-associated phospholipid phosphatase
MRLTSTSIAALAAIAVLSLPSSAARAESPYELKNSQEWVWVGSGVSLCLGGWIGSHNVEPLTSAQVQALDAGGINSLDRNTMSPFRDDHAGDTLAITSFFVPLAFLTRDDMRADAGMLATMWVEAAGWTEGLSLVAKGIAKRTRPYAYDPDAPDDLKTKKEARLSFYSAHAAGAAMNCFFMAKVFSDYSSNRNAEIAMWSGAVLYPALTGFFRVDSGHHFTTDAISGVLVGAAVGYLVPALHHSDSGVSLEPESNSGGLGFTATFSF